MKGIGSRSELSGSGNLFRGGVYFDGQFDRNYVVLVVFVRGDCEMQ